MENKSLGRGFREISNIFISKNSKRKITPKKSEEDNDKSSRSLADESARGPHNPFIAVNHEQNVCGKNRSAEDTENDNEGYESTLSKLLEKNGECSDLAESMREVEENVMVEKNISYPNTPDAPQNLIKTLCAHLEEGFSIKKIELSRTDTTCRPGKKKSKTEKITIFLEEPPALAEI